MSQAHTNGIKMLDTAI